MGASKLFVAIFGLTILIQLANEVSAADNISYIGAVVSYYPVKTGTNGTTIATANANNYVTIISRASNYSTDIIVFPEGSLTEGLTFSATNRTLYPSFSSFIPDEGIDIPCDNASTVVMDALKLISCAAKNYSMYVVVNLSEKENCTTTGTTSRPCPTDGYFFYNTNVVFNRTGGLISRYRKFNIFGESGFNVTSVAENATFTTDFNVTFGHFICFDILFKSPALDLISDYNATDILFPAHWFSELPYLTAVQTQSAWSYSNNVNLLASGYNTPATASGGSGIYIGTGGNLGTIYSESAKNAVLVARVPRLINGSRTYIAPSTYPVTYEFNNTEITTLVNITTVAQQPLLQEVTVPLFNTTFLTLANGTSTTSVELCDSALCCYFHVNATFDSTIVNASSTNYYRYRIAVFNGVRDHSGVATTGSEICSIISCTNDTLSTCGTRFEATDTVVQPTVFNSIVISGNFTNSSDTHFQMPDSLTTDILPLNASDFVYTKVGYTGSTLANVTFNLTSQISNLMTFAIFGRNFTSDGLAATTAANSTVSSALSLSQLSMVNVFLAVIISSLIMIRK